MNKTRRKEISLIVRRLFQLQENINQGGDIDIDNILDDIRDDISFLHWEEDYYLQNIPENLQNGYRYQLAEEACDNLEDAMNVLDNAQGKNYNNQEKLKCIEDAIQYLHDAAT